MDIVDLDYLIGFIYWGGSEPVPGCVGDLLAVGCNSDSLSESLQLGQNYPNPFNPTTTIEFSLTERSEVCLSVLNILGQKVAVLFQGTLAEGPHSYEWSGRRADGAPAANGVYFYRLESGGDVLSRKMLLLK